MIIVGELINTSRKGIKEPVKARDAEFIKKLAKDQVDNGATYVDVNCGTFVFDEEEVMTWLINTVQEVVNAPLAIDSPDPKVMAAGLKLCKNGTPIVNSISLESNRFDAVLPVVQEYKCNVVALCMTDKGMPSTKDERMQITEELVKRLTDAGVSEKQIYIDPCVAPISTDTNAGLAVLETIRDIKKNFGVNTICGMSNISYGLPVRKLLNRAFAVQLVYAGIDGLITDPLDKLQMGLITAAVATVGKDKSCLNYLKSYRKGLLE